MLQADEGTTACPGPKNSFRGGLPSASDETANLAGPAKPAARGLVARGKGSGDVGKS